MTEGLQLGSEEVAALRAALAAAELRADAAEARASVVEAKASSDAALIAHLKLEIAKLKRARFGQTSERSQRLLDQYELQLEELEASAAIDELKAEMAAARTTSVQAFVRRRPSRQPCPEHLPRERVVIAAPTSCPCCGGGRLSKLGEDVTETLEVVPRQWKVIATVRERFSCRDCQTITQPPAPFHVTARGWAGPSLLAMIAFEKFGQHQPLNRQAERYAREGVPLSLSTLADQVGAICMATLPLYRRLEAHVLAAERLHGDDTTVPVLAAGKTDVARIWNYVRDDRPFSGPAPPAAIFYYSRDRRAEHPQAHLAAWAGVLQADAYGGYNKLYEPGRSPGPVLQALCWSHGRRHFFELADVAESARRAARGKPAVISPIALEAVKRIDRIFDVEREITGRPAAERLAAPQPHTRALGDALEAWMREQRARLSRHDPVAKALDYMLTRWAAFTRFLDDGRVCLTNNAAERALRGLALGRKSWLFCGSDRGGHRAAQMYSLIVTCKLNDVDPQAWLADVLARIASHPVHRLDDLLPWNWKAERDAQPQVA